MGLSFNECRTFSVALIGCHDHSAICKAAPTASESVTLPLARIGLAELSFVDSRFVLSTLIFSIVCRFISHKADKRILCGTLSTQSLVISLPTSLRPISNMNLDTRFDFAFGVIATITGFVSIWLAAKHRERKLDPLYCGAMTKLNLAGILPTFVNNWFNGTSDDTPSSVRSSEELPEQRIGRRQSLYVLEETISDNYLPHSRASGTLPLAIMLSQMGYGQDGIPPGLGWTIPWPLRPPLAPPSQNISQPVDTNGEEPSNSSDDTPEDSIAEEADR